MKRVTKIECVNFSYVLVSIECSADEFYELKQTVKVLNYEPAIEGITNYQVLVSGERVIEVQDFMSM